MVCRVLSLSKLDAAIPRPLKPSEVAAQQAKVEQLVRKIERKQQRSAAVSEASGGQPMSQARRTELQELQSQLDALKAEQQHLANQTTSFSVDDMHRTPLPKVLTPVIMNHRYACEFGLEVDTSAIKSAGEDIRQNAIEVSNEFLKSFVCAWLF